MSNFFKYLFITRSKFQINDPYILASGVFITKNGYSKAIEISTVFEEEEAEEEEAEAEAEAEAEEEEVAEVAEVAEAEAEEEAEEEEAE